MRATETVSDLTPDAGAAIERDPATGGYPLHGIWNLVFIQYDKRDDAWWHRCLPTH